METATAVPLAATLGVPAPLAEPLWLGEGVTLLLLLLGVPTPLGCREPDEVPLPLAGAPALTKPVEEGDSDRERVANDVALCGSTGEVCKGRGMKVEEDGYIKRGREVGEGIQARGHT